MIGAQINHVWQSTVFAMAAGLITLVFRHNRAAVRYGLWLSASVKFLLPFSLLMGIGHHLGLAPVKPVVTPTPSVALSIIQVSEPFPKTIAVTGSRQGVHDWAAIGIAAVWACGFVMLARMRWRGWLRIRAAVRASAPIDGFGAMPVRSSAGLLEPGVVGLFRPILLLPEDIAERLQPLQLEAVLAHELCHVRRRDNITSAMHMVVEALFWFHPLVWWIGARLVEERERACDEAVLSLGNTPQDYAEGILNVCKSYVESPLSCVSGVTGSNLKKRLQEILTKRVAGELSFPKKVLLAVVAVIALMLPVAVGILSAPRIEAQMQPSTARFETASIRSCQAFRKGTMQDWSRGRVLRTECTTVGRLIQQAYGLFANGQMNSGSFVAVVGGPDWTSSELYEIEAKAADPQSRATMNGPMLRALLEDRFQLKVHRETKEVPVYTLNVAEGGPKLQPFQGSCTPRDFDKPPSPEDCGTARGFGNGFEMHAATMAGFCAGFSVLLDRHVLDETGITGRFNLRVDVPPEDRELLNRPRSLPALSDPTAAPPPPIPFEAARTAMEKLGLKLEATNGPGELILIDQVERPAGN